MKNSSDIANYDSEFSNLRVQLHQIASTKFNGSRLFGTGVAFGSSNTNMKSIITSADGETTVSINQSQLLSALTIDTSDGNCSVTWICLTFNCKRFNIYTFAAADSVMQ